MISVNFANITNSTGYTLDEVFPGTTEGLTAYRQQGQADYVQLWDAENGTYASTDYYLYVSRNGDQPGKDYTWRQNANTPAPIKIKSGDSMWFYKRGSSAVTVNVSGAVEFNATTKPTIQIYPGWNMIAAPYAAGLNLNANSQEYWRTCGASAYRGQAQADYVQIWDAASGGYAPTSYFLYVSRNADNPTADYTWRQNANTIAPTELTSMGEG